MVLTKNSKTFAHSTKSIEPTKNCGVDVSIRRRMSARSLDIEDEHPCLVSVSELLESIESFVFSRNGDLIRTGPADVDA
jgi:hypothetical protein